jgi:Flp pilus assembly protein TadB
VSKHSRDGTVEEDKTAPAEAEIEQSNRGVNWSRVVAYGVLPGLAMILAMAAGFLKWQDNSVRSSEIARIESVQAAKDTTDDTDVVVQAQQRRAATQRRPRPAYRRLP